VQAAGRSGRPEKLDAIDRDPNLDERSKAEIRTPKERARDLEHKILAPRLAKQLTPDEFEEKLEEKDRKDKLEHFLKTVTRKDVIEVGWVGSYPFCRRFLKRGEGFYDCCA
jgi:hypothetical protein